MCLILFAVNPNEQYRLVVAANRDELYERPTQHAQFWHDQPELLAGRDESAGGTWLGVNRRGHFAAVTNFREEPPAPLPPASRGDLPTEFLTGNLSPADYCADVARKDSTFRGFNLLTVDSDQSCYHSNRNSVSSKVLDPGYYGLSNQLLDCDWPKVIAGREKLANLIQSNDLVESLFSLLMDDGDGTDFSNSFIQSELYGTRAATVVTITTSGEVYFEERNFGVNGKPAERNQFGFTCIDGP